LVGLELSTTFGSGGSQVAHLPASFRFRLAYCFCFTLLLLLFHWGNQQPWVFALQSLSSPT
jgi:hypothetical protein